MTHVALKDFPLSRDGVKIERIAAGDPVEVPEGILQGLIDEGFIGLPDAIISSEPIGSEGDGSGEGDKNPAGAPMAPEGAGDGSEGDGEKNDGADAKASTRKSGAAKNDGTE